MPNTSMTPQSAARLRRLGAAGCLVASPILLALGLITIPGTSTEHFDNFAGHEGLAQVSAVLLHWGWVILIPGILGLVPVMRGRGLILGNVAVGLAALGLVNWSAFLLIDFFDLALLAELDRASADQVKAGLDSLPGAVFGFLAPGALMTALGVPLVFVALALSHRVPWWCPVLVVIGIGLFLVLSAGPTVLRPTGAFLLLIAFGMAASALVKADQDVADLVPVGSS